MNQRQMHRQLAQSFLYEVEADKNQMPVGGRGRNNVVYRKNYCVMPQGLQNDIEKERKFMERERRKVMVKSVPVGRGRVLAVNTKRSINNQRPLINENLSAAEKVFAVMPHVIEQTVAYVDSGFEKINILKACPKDMRQQYDHIIQKLSSHDDENDALFF